MYFPISQPGRSKVYMRVLVMIKRQIRKNILREIIGISGGAFRDGKKYLLGIDNGGTYSKAALFDLHGNQVEKRSIQIPVYAPKEG